MDGGRCGVTEQFATRAEARARLQTNRPLFYVRTAPPGIMLDDLADRYERAFARWTAEADVRTRRIYDLAERQPSDVLNVIDAAALGSGVLADQQLANGSNTVLQMRISTRVDWNRVDMVATLAHEIGHFFGLEHFPSGPPPELMEPVLSTITHPQPTEAAVVRAHFGIPMPLPPNPPTPPGPAPSPSPLPPLPDNCCFRLRPAKQALYARIPMNLTADEQVKVEAAKKAIAALDCATIAKTLLSELLNALAGRVCPPQAKESQ